MIRSFQENRDIYSFIASIAFNMKYEDCLEFNPITKAYQPEGKARRSESKSVVLGILYGRSIKTIGEQLYSNVNLDDDKILKQATHVYNAVLDAFPALRRFMHNAQECARTKGYVETILGRRRHIPDMQLPEYEFRAMSGYVNPDIDPMDINTLDHKNDIPERIQRQLYQELKSYRYFGQRVKRIRELDEYEHIRVINNTRKIDDATRQCVNSVVQGSAADLTKLAMIRVESDPRWNAIGGRVLVPVHDELIAEVPIDKWKEGGEILSECMCSAASFLPFPIKCDVTTTYRWYGLEYPCPHNQATSTHPVDKSEISWIQYHLFEVGYELPVYKTADGRKPEGDEALGINGIWSDDMENDICDYCSRYHITEDKFLDHIHTKVHTGYAPEEIH